MHARRFLRSFLGLGGLVLVACAPAPVTPARPVATAPKERPALSGAAAIDAALREHWKKAGVVPAPRADDATFLRRAYVDVVGTVPPVDVTRRFLADPAPDKRARLVEALIASNEWAEHWMNYWDDVLMGRDTRGNVVDRAAFRSWLRGRFAAHAPWDQIVRELVSATGRNGSGGPKAKAAGLAIAPAEDDDEGAVNGAVNWTLRFEQSPQDLGGNASRIFLGVQIQCAQCHDHKTESWKQDDFRRFTSAFFRTKVQPLDPVPPSGTTKRGKPMGLRRVELVDAASAPPRFAKKMSELEPVVRAKPTALDGTDLEQGAGTRKALAAWMTSKENRWFARAFVNRMWGHFLGRGFYDPVDDIRPSNPATAPELLDAIAADFVAHDFDVRWLVRTICATEAYNLAAQRRSSDDLWASFHLVPLGPEELLNAIFRVTDVEAAAQRAGIANMDALRATVARQYAFVFDTDEEADAPDYSGTVTQALALLNGALVRQGSRALPGGTAAEIANGTGSDEEKIDALALKVLARPATAEERERWLAYVREAHGERTKPKPKAGKRDPLERLSNRRAGAVPPRTAAYEDLLWALLNTSEFSFNH